MILLDAKDYCQNCEYFNPVTSKMWIGEKFMTIIRCVNCVKCEGIYNSIKEKVSDEKKGIYDSIKKNVGGEKNNG